MRAPDVVEGIAVNHIGGKLTMTISHSTASFKLADRPGNLPFPASDPLAERRLVREGQERLDNLKNLYMTI